VFSWPSDGQAIPWKSYISDRHDAESSAFAVARAILKFADFIKTGVACGQEVHLMCHSMGNYVLRNCVQAMLKMQASLPRLFENIFLMAADEDDDAMEYEEKLLPIIHLAKEVYIYFNRGDLALRGSDWTKGNPDRLGSNGPRYPLNVANKVTLVDCTDVVDSANKNVGHSYFWDNRVVAGDLLQVVMGTDDDKIPNRVYDPRKNKFVLTWPQ
jgi:esterase/lipase superfamily enzyme